MATVNRYSNIQPARYTPRTLQELMVAPAYMRQQQDALDSLSQELQSKIGEIKVLDVDNPLVQQEQDKLYSKLEEQSANLASKGFSPTAKSDFIKLNSDYRKFMSPTGIGGKASANYNAYNENIKELNKLYQKGLIGKEKYQLGAQYALDKYTESGGVKNDTVYNPFIASLDQNINERARQVAKDLQGNLKILEEFGIEKRGNRYYDVEKQRSYTPEEAINYGIQLILGSDTNVQSDLLQREQLGLLGGKSAQEYLANLGSMYEKLYAVDRTTTSRTGYYDPLEMHRAKKEIDKSYENNEIPFEKYSNLNIEIFNKADIDKVRSVLSGKETIVTDQYTSRGDASFLKAVYDVITGKAETTPKTINDINSTLKTKMETIFEGLKLEDPSLEGKSLMDKEVLTRVADFMEKIPQVQVQPKINKIPVEEGVKRAKELVIDARSKEFYDPQTNEFLSYKDMVKKGYFSNNTAEDQSNTFYRGQMQSDHAYTSIMPDEQKAAEYAIPEVYIINGKEFLVPNKASELYSPYYKQEQKFNTEFNKLKTTLPQKYTWTHTELVDGIPTTFTDEVKVRLKANNSYTIELPNGNEEIISQEFFKNILMESTSE